MGWFACSGVLEKFGHALLYVCKSYLPCESISSSMPRSNRAPTQLCDLIKEHWRISSMQSIHYLCFYWMTGSHVLTSTSTSTILHSRSIELFAFFSLGCHRITREDSKNQEPFFSRDENPSLGFWRGTKIEGRLRHTRALRAVRVDGKNIYWSYG